MVSVWPSIPPGRVPARRLPPQPALPRVKVLHVITRFIAGSGGNTLVSAAGMDPDRYDTWVAGMPGGPLWEQARAAGVGTVEIRHMRERISPWHDLMACRELTALIRREHFTVVHTHCSKAGLIARVAARLAGTPVIVHTFHILAAHDGLSPARRRVYLALERFVRGFAHHYIAVAPRLARQAVEQRVAPPGRVSVVPSAVDLSAIPATEAVEVRAELGIAEGARVVGTVGRLVPQKAPLDFVRLCALVRRQEPDTVFVMVGDTTLESEGLRERPDVRRTGSGCRSCSRDSGTTPHGWPPRSMCTSSPLVTRGWVERSPRRWPRAGPVVATAVNGVPDLVEPGATGLLADPGDVEGLAEATLWMLRHPVEAGQMGERGRERVRSHFAPETMCSALDALYSGLLGLPASSPPEEHTVARHAHIQRTA